MDISTMGTVLAIVSGLASTGADQVVKQTKKAKEE